MDLLKNTQFLKLWGNQILLQIAFNLTNFTALLLIDNLVSSRLALAEFYTVITIPAFLVGIFAGSIVDLANRKRLMLITDAILAVLFLLYILAGSNFLLILAIAFVASSTAQFFIPAEAATIPILVSAKELESANSLFLFTALGSVLLGYALAGPIIQIFGGLEHGGSMASFAFASATSIIGFVLLLSLNSIETTKPKITKGVLITTLKLTREVFLTVKNNIKLSLSIFLLALMEFGFGTLAIIFIDFVKKYLKLPSTAISYFLILPTVIGLSFGVSILGKIQNIVGRGISIFIGILLFGLSMLSLGLLSSVLDIYTLRIITMVAAFLVGISAVLLSVHARTILQENTPPQMLGRVFAFVTIAISATVPMPILFLAFLGEKVDVAYFFIIFGGILITISLGLKNILERRLT